MLNKIKIIKIILTHRLVLKVNVSTMLLRNMDQKNGLCDGTRLRVINLGRRFVEVKVILGTNVGYRTYIIRYGVTPSYKKLSFKSKRM